MAGVTLCQRTFSKMVFIPTNTSGLELTCTDSSGNTINCNYINVQFSPSATSTGLATLFVEPSGGVSYTQNVSSLSNTNLSGAAGSGAGGFAMAAIFGDSTCYEYVCLPNENFNKVIFRNLIMGGTAAVTFGTVVPLNPVKLGDRFSYTKGS
jgi:hypothetical protein